ncbi:MAG: glycoside hydrolase family 5 protein [Oscillospiraceae bacterium]|nr:glycoside hydrolase family 5 protein [Oscillospiraceae bacterium]
MKKYGFNMLWMFSYHGKEPQKADEKQLDFIAEQGFNFIRIPTDYNFWTKDFDYLNPDEKVFETIDSYLEACKSRGLHMCLNLHRAPGYCINANDREKHNLWKDEPAKEAFAFLWECFAKRYKGVPNTELSFDLLNEPPNIGQYGFTRDIHEAVMRGVIAVIRAADPAREIVLDGIAGGGVAIPELADAGVIHSGRGYAPFEVSHYKASWCGIKDEDWKEPVYPGKNGSRHWDKDALRAYYAPWVEVEKKGVEVHIGEFGCFNRTPNDIALRWLGDLMSVFKERKWGYSMWNFEGSFGIVNHKRPGAVYTNIGGFEVDKQLLDIMLENMVK